MTTEQRDRPLIAPKLQETLDDLAKYRGRPLICIVGELNNHVADGLWVYYLGTLRNHKKLSVLIHSQGGDAKAAYRMISTLRRYAKDIEVLVPNEAKSAATLFCLGANTIYIGYRGELGPLDTQIRDRIDENYHSALESFKASEQLLEHAVLVLKRTIATTRPTLSRWQRQITSAIRIQARPFMQSIVSNLYKDFDADELGRNSRYLAEIEEYAIRAMSRGGYQDDKKAREVARRLVWEYPSHDFFIDLQEAQDIGLNAVSLAEPQEVHYALAEPDILKEMEVESVDELMEGSKGTFFGIGFPPVSDEQDDLDIDEPGTESTTTSACGL